MIDVGNSSVTIATRVLVADCTLNAHTLRLSCTMFYVQYSTWVVPLRWPIEGLLGNFHGHILAVESFICCFYLFTYL